MKSKAILTCACGEHTHALEETKNCSICQKTRKEFDEEVKKAGGLDKYIDKLRVNTG